MGWIDVKKELPMAYVKVDLSYGLFGIRGAACDEWISEGWVTKGGNWSIKWKNGMPKFPEPTHWKPKE